MPAPNSRFPAPNYNQVIDTDPQIVQVPLEPQAGMWGFGKASLPSSIKNDQTIEHVKSQG